MMGFQEIQYYWRMFWMRTIIKGQEKNWLTRSNFPYLFRIPYWYEKRRFNEIIIRKVF